jgi:hypothetical protein
MEPLIIKQNDLSIEILPEKCSFYAVFGISLIRILVYTKNLPHLSQNTWKSLINLLESSKYLARQYNLLEKYSALHQLLILLRSSSENAWESMIKHYMLSPKAGQAIEVGIKCILSHLFPDNSSSIMACKEYSLAPIHLQILSDALEIHLSLSLPSGYETYYCNKPRSLVIFFYKISDTRYSIVKDIVDYQLYYTNKPSIPADVVSLINSFSDIFNSVMHSKYLIRLQKVCNTYPGVFNTLAINTMKAINPALNSTIQAFQCENCNQEKQEILTFFCPNQCKICSFCITEEECAKCGVKIT